MKDLYLKFPDEQTSLNYLFKKQFNEEGQEIQQIPLFTAIDIIGIIYQQTQIEEEPFVIFNQLDGWHVNVRAYDDEDTSSLEQFLVHPETPHRIWA